MYNSRKKTKVLQYHRYLRILENNDPELKILPNKKKIRNWETLVKRLTDLKNQYIFATQDELKLYLEKFGHIYMKLNVDPWNRINKRNPPYWYRKLFFL